MPTIDLVGIGAADRPWHLTVRTLGAGPSLVRLSDRSATLAAERMRTDFVANASHELRTPLATIIGYAETLAEDGAIDEALRRRFGTTIHVEARRMLRIVEDLMSLSRIEADRFDVPDDIVDLAEVAQLAIGHSAALAEQRGCTVGLAQGGADPGSRRFRPAAATRRQSDRQCASLWLHARALRGRSDGGRGRRARRADRA